MNKNIKLIAAGLLISFFAAGCATTSEDKQVIPQQINKEEATKLNMIADRYGNDLLKAIKDNDYELFVSHFMPEAKKKITRSKFEKRMLIIKEKFGDMTSHKFLTSLDQNVLKSFVWKTEFVKTTEKGPVKLEELFRMIIVKVDNQYYIWNFYFY